MKKHFLSLLAAGFSLMVVWSPAFADCSINDIAGTWVGSYYADTGRPMSDSCSMSITQTPTFDGYAPANNQCMPVGWTAVLLSATACTYAFSAVDYMDSEYAAQGILILNQSQNTMQGTLYVTQPPFLYNTPMSATLVLTDD